MNPLTGKKADDLMELVRECKRVDALGNISQRNVIAERIFKNRRSRHVSFNLRTVETWWNSYETSYVTQTKDWEGAQIGEAPYSGNKLGAAVQHVSALYELLEPYEPTE